METDTLIKVMLAVIGLMSGFILSQLTMVGKVKAHAVMIGFIKDEIEQFLSLTKELIKQNTVLIAELRASKK